MDLREEIGKQVDMLPPNLQEEVLRFVNSLSSRAAVTGEPGSALRQFARYLDPVSNREIAQAIEEECERVDPSQW